MHIPNTCTTEVPSTPIRLALFGAAKTGKTEASLTFPNPIFADWDNGLTGHEGEPIVRAPFCDKAWREKTWPNIKLPHYAFKKWLDEEARKFTSEQTLVIDSYTTFQDVLVKTEHDTAPVGKTGEKDGFAVWRSIGEFHRDVHTIFRELSCNLVVCFHEQLQRDANGNPTSKIEPLLVGQFKDKYSIHYTDVFRQVVKENTATKQIEYLWQVKGDSIANCGTRMKLPAGTTHVKAHHSSFTY